MVEVEVSSHDDVFIVLRSDVLLQIFSQGIYEVVVVGIVDVDYKHRFVGEFGIDGHCYNISKREVYWCKH